jgi:hypothetical protein
MHSPFPGMDPYLEDPTMWSDVHHRLIAAIGDDLVAHLSPNYFVRIQERVYITHETNDPGYTALIPDVTITEGRPWPTAPGDRPGGVMVLPSVEVELLMEPEIRDRFLTVHDRRSQKVVTTVEVLIPANKVKNSHGRQMLQAKRQALIAAGASYLEIDLLRAGECAENLAGRSDYLVTLQRNAWQRLRVWFIGLRDPLPAIGVPLSAPHEEVVLDLQRILNEVYERAHYADSVEYTDLPPPALSAPDVHWVGRQLTSWRAEQEKD